MRVGLIGAGNISRALLGGEAFESNLEPARRAAFQEAMDTVRNGSGR